MATSCENHKLPNKEFTFPKCWKDSATMKTMFSTFRMRQLDPEQYDLKMKFWKDLIRQYCYFSCKANFSERELQLFFICGDRLPACLDTVILDMQHHKQIRLRSEYECDPENTWTGWFINSFTKRPFSWGWTKLKNVVIAEDLNAPSAVEWICLEVINYYCKELDDKILRQKRGKLLHFQAFKLLCDSHQVQISLDFLLLCLKTLHTRNKLALEYTNEKQERQIHIIKIPGEGSTDVKITESDHALYNLHMTQTFLLKQIEDLEEEISSTMDRARAYVKDNKRQLAKTYLRKKQLLEKNHERRSVALHNIESLLSSVDEAQTNGIVLDAYKIGAKTLQKVLADSGLKYDNVDEVLADVRDTLDQHNELQETLSNGVEDVTSMEEDSLDRELSDLIEQCSTKRIHQSEIEISDTELINLIDDLSVENGPISNTKRTMHTLHS